MSFIHIPVPDGIEPKEALWKARRGLRLRDYCLIRLARERKGGPICVVVSDTRLHSLRSKVGDIAEQVLGTKNHGFQRFAEPPAESVTD